MNANSLLIPLCLTALAACAQAPKSMGHDSAAPQGAVREAGPAPSTGLTEPILYELLLGEIAAQRGEPGLASEAYADLSYKTRDPRVVKRAVELAVKAQHMDQALGLARLWTELSPADARARQLLISLLMRRNLLAEAQGHVATLLALPGRSPAVELMHLNNLLGRHKDAQAGLSMVETVASPYLDLPEAHYAIAQAALQAGKIDRAIQALDAALGIRPDWQAAALLQGQLLQNQGEGAMLAFWRNFLAANPGASEVRMAYAKSLAKAGSYQEARQEFGKMMDGKGDQAEIAYAMGLLSLQINDYDEAEARFQQAIRQGYPDPVTVQLYLAQVSESRQQYDEALRRYDAIGPGERHLEAQIKSAVMLGKLKRFQEGQARLAAIEPGTDKERIQVIQAEAQMYRDGGEHLRAFEILDEAIRRMPDSTDLLYDRAMAAEKLDRLDVLEADLRRVIQIAPDFAHAYNALGYTLADRDQRLEEALELLEKALQLAPEDAFIMDSMGWALYKAGRLGEAEGYLRRAYASRPDPEIAAHLGEVLWAAGKRDEARQVWEEAKRQFPDNDVLRETLARLKP